ncbi:MAG TPA: SdrD B-like domain-containing protein [Phycisphaerae bacterium]|nr:SdrD B-like domain-containing protein [Phycisphaerae bacterium]
METLETRTLFSLVGVESLIQAPIVAVNSGAITYTAGSPAGTLSAQARLGVDLQGTSGFAFGVLTINATVDSSGNLVVPGTFTITSGANTLLSGVTDPTANQQGFGFDMTSGQVDFQFKVTGGNLLANYATDDIGVLLNTEPPGTFPGFGSSFSMVVKGAEVGTIPEVGNAPASLFGHKYEDQTGDGLTADDLAHPLSGFTINLFADTNTDGVLDSGDALAGTTTTAADGSYSFTGLQAGTYFVQEVNQPTYTETAPPGNTYTVTLASGDNKGSFDFDNFQNISISGTKFDDLNDNGSRDTGEMGLGGWTIKLYTDTGGVLTDTGLSTVTAADGSYSFSNLAPLAAGTTYAVREVQQSGWIQATTNPADITPTSGLVDTGNDFGNFQIHNPGIVTTPSSTESTAVGAGEFATIGFWHNKNGQQVITSFNTGASSTLLGNWLATNFSNLFGASNVYTGTSLAGLTNAQVAQVYLNLWTPSGLNKNTYVQTFAVALGLYADTTGLGGASLVSNGLASQFGFVVTPGGAGMYNIGSNGAAFGVPNNTSVSVMTILQFLNANFSPATGTFFGGDATKTAAANNVVNGINTTGDIPGNASLTTVGELLNDSATLSGGFNPTGTITFYLFAPGTTPLSDDSNAVYSDTVTVSGNGTYTTAAGTNPGGYAATALGTYQWVAVYSGDSLNNPYVSPFGLEPWPVGSPPLTINTIDGGPVALGSALTDTADIEGGNNPQGSVVFRLYAPGDTTYSSPIYTSAPITVNGDGKYGSPATVSFTPTVAGTYEWIATFTSSDANNPNISSDPGDEPETVTPGGTIKGTKYVDAKGDDCSTTIGKNDDTAYTGPAITINLIQNGSIVATTTTDSHGNYEFDNLAAGTYTIQEVVPTGWVETAQSMGAVTLANGGTSTGNNIADFKLTCISGTKFNDITGNGFSSDDTGLAGITIDLFKNGSNNPVATTVTGADGSYSFNNLGPGSYYVQEADQPAGWTQTGGLAGYTINATSGGNYTGNNFDDYHTLCVVTCFHYEINGCKIVNDISGQLHQGDVVKVIFTISGPGTVSFVSYTAPDSYFNSGDADQQKLFDVATGTYSKAGTYCLTIVVPNCDYQVDFICGLPIDVLGTNANVFYTPQHRLHDSDNGGSTNCIPGKATCNGGGTITGCIFNDHNNDGKKASGDEGICGVRVTCYGTTNDGKCLLLNCYTDANGNYCFSNLPSGCYKIIEHGPDNYYDGSQCAGNYGGTCGDDMCSNITCTGTRTCSGYNFGELCGSDISGSVFCDKDKDGHDDSNESGIANVKITLTGTDYLGNAVSLVTYTDAYGNYDFGNLAAGTYTLTETEPSGYTTTKDTAGTSGGTVQTGDKITHIVLAWSTDATGYNFGESTSSSGGGGGGYYGGWGWGW